MGAGSGISEKVAQCASEHRPAHLRSSLGSRTNLAYCMTSGQSFDLFVPRFPLAGTVKVIHPKESLGGVTLFI